MADPKNTNPLPEGESSLNSAITTDIPNDAPQPAAGGGMATVDLSKGKIEVPADAITTAEEDAPSKLSAAEEAEMKSRDNSFEQRAADAGVGLVRVDGIDLRYIGIAPARDKDPKTPGGFPISSENSTFTPLANVTFHPSVRIKDPTSGEFYYPADGTSSYELAEHNGNFLVSREPDKKAGAARRKALLDTKTA